MRTSCPLCHTSSPTITDNLNGATGAWQCTRCGHRWDNVRLATAAAYLMYAQDQPTPAGLRLPDVHY